MLSGSPVALYIFELFLCTMYDVTCPQVPFDLTELLIFGSKNWVRYQTDLKKDKARDFINERKLAAKAKVT